MIVYHLLAVLLQCFNTSMHWMLHVVNPWWELETICIYIAIGIQNFQSFTVVIDHNYHTQYEYHITLTYCKGLNR